MGTDFPSCGSVRSTSGKKREFPYGWDESLRFLINRLRSFLGPPSPLLSWMILTRWKLSKTNIVESFLSFVLGERRIGAAHWRNETAM